MIYIEQNLKTADELEEEDRAAQSAKLQELIRRGTPRDLAAAQELMKQLAGAEPEKKPDYRAQSLTELNKLEQKVILLNEMLDNVDTQRGERFASGDVYDVRSHQMLLKWVIFILDISASQWYSCRGETKNTKMDIRCGDRRSRNVR